MTMEDTDNLLQIFSDEEAMRFYPSTKNQEETKKWIQRTFDNYTKHGIGLWIFETKEGGEFVGQTGLVPQTIEANQEIEIGYLFARKHWGKGYATEAAIGCKNYGITQLGLRRFVSVIRPENERSIRVAERIGMVFERIINFHEKKHHLYSINC